MRDGFVKVAAASIVGKVADCRYNEEQIVKTIGEMEDRGVKVLALPELCITSYSVGDLLFQDTLVRSAEEAVLRVLKATEESEILFTLGIPFRYRNKLYNVALICQKGAVLGIVPKTHLPNYGEYGECRYFAPAPTETVTVDCVFGEEIPFGTDQIFVCRDLPDLSVGCEICEDAWVMTPPSNSLCEKGATVILNLSASGDMVGKAQARRGLLSVMSSKQMSAYVYADAGLGESSTDLVYGGHTLVYENGSLLAEGHQLYNIEGAAVSEVDVCKLAQLRQKRNTFGVQNAEYVNFFSLTIEETVLTRKISDSPFVPKNEATRMARAEEIVALQTAALAKRLSHIGCGSVIGISGGLDSTLALLITAQAYDRLGQPRTRIHAVTMPGFGTTGRTRSNAEILCERLGVTFSTVPIAAAVKQHFADIGHDGVKTDVTYENAQARERTQIIMDIANMENAIVIGTGDLSELVLGWATYNGDHMSMYGVNGSIPKTLVRHLVYYFAMTAEDAQLKKTLLDILDTPVSPELLPPDKDGKIAQVTEDLVGPYSLHDFFLFYFLRYGFGPKKIYRMAKYAFEGQYSDETILKWLTTFHRRFFAQQFKRSCLPDGPKVGTVGVSPRGDLRLPSDALNTVWMEELKELAENA